MLLNPNCSEAVMRIKTGNMTPEQKRKLLNDLNKRLQEDYENEVGEKESFGENSIYESKIFGIPHIVVSGNAPFHADSSKEIKKILTEHKVKNEWVETDEQ